MQWLDTASNVVIAILTAVGTIGGWIVGRELKRNEDDHKGLSERMEQIEQRSSALITREEFSRLEIAADLRFKQLDQDIKNTGAEVQRVLREELGKINSRLDQVIMSLKNS